MHSLRELQASFAAGLRADPRSGAPALDTARLTPGSHFSVYRNNVEAVFEEALARTYSVLRTRVGAAYFATLAREYRRVHPSRSGDLHWVGRAFPAFLATHLVGGDYAWLAELATLEWACEEALVLPVEGSVGVQALADVPPGRWAACRLRPQRSTRWVESGYPLFTIWQRNQQRTAEPVDLAGGGECVVLRASEEGVMLYRRAAPECRLVAALASGAPLGAAAEAAGLEGQALTDALAWLFAEGFITGVIAP